MIGDYDDFPFLVRRLDDVDRRTHRRGRDSDPDPLGLIVRYGRLGRPPRTSLFLDRRAGPAGRVTVLGFDVLARTGPPTAAVPADASVWLMRRCFVV